MYYIIYLVQQAVYESIMNIFQALNFRKKNSHDKSHLRQNKIGACIYTIYLNNIWNQYTNLLYKDNLKRFHSLAWYIFILKVMQLKSWIVLFIKTCIRFYSFPSMFLFNKV